MSADEDAPGFAGRAIVVGALLLLLLGGLGGIEAWPLTEWRLFSASRDETQTTYVVAAVVDGELRPVDLEDLPLGYRTAEWPLARLGGMSGEERDEVCAALRDVVIEHVGHPEDIEVRLLRDQQTLVERDASWIRTHDAEVLHSCDGSTG